MMDLIELYNHNIRQIKRQLSMQKLQELYRTYKPVDDGHLAKILSIRKIRL